MISSGRRSLSRENLKLLDEQLALYVCLTSMINLTDMKGEKILGPDGVVLKVCLKQICHPRLSESIITKCCYEVTDYTIESFFGNAGLAAAWETVSVYMRRYKPEFTGVFNYIDRIKQRVLRP